MNQGFASATGREVGFAENHGPQSIIGLHGFFRTIRDFLRLLSRHIDHQNAADFHLRPRSRGTTDSNQTGTVTCSFMVQLGNVCKWDQ